jgi:uncharacterized phage infection (PIP) family protein YhgE
MYDTVHRIHEPSSPGQGVDGPRYGTRSGHVVMHGAVEAQPPPPLPPAENMETHPSPPEQLSSHIKDATEQVTRDGSGLDSIAELLEEAAERSKQRDTLHESLTEGLGRETAERARTQQALASAQEELQRVNRLLMELESRRSHEEANALEELTRLRASLEESEAMRKSEAALARQAAGTRQMLEKAAADSNTELQRLRDALEAERARLASAEGSRGAAALELERERQRLSEELAKERQRSASAMEQQNALGMGVRLKNKKLEAEVQKLREQLEHQRARADGAERAVAEAQGAALHAAQRASHAEGMVASQLDDQHEREARAAAEAKAKADSAQRQLADALKTCEVAKRECARVRQRNEELEDERYQLRSSIDAGGRDTTKLSAVLEQFDDMETMLDPAKAKEAERRLRERAVRAHADEIAARLPGS